MSTTSRRPRRGEFWWFRLPGQAGDAHQPRPVLVISDSTRNQLAGDVIVVPAFTRGRLGPTRVALPAGAGGLPRDGVLFCDEVTTIADVLLAGGPLGPPVSSDLLDLVLRAVRRALGEMVPEP